MQQLLQIASVLFILHICYHPWLQQVHSAPVKETSINDGIHNSVEQLHEDFENKTAIAEVLKSSAMANVSAEMLRSDGYSNSTNPFLAATTRHMSYIIWISRETWASYQLFKRDTCRTDSEEPPKFVEDNDFLESGYFKWEENEFHRELRILLFPETSSSLKPLIDAEIIDKLDKRFLQKPLESFCFQKEVAQQKHSAEEIAADEKAKFEDTVLNRVFEPR